MSVRSILSSSGMATGSGDAFLTALLAHIKRHSQSLGAATTSAQRSWWGPKPERALRLSLVHLVYVLVRFEEAGLLPAGSDLDEPLPDDVSFPRTTGQSSTAADSLSIRSFLPSVQPPLAPLARLQAIFSAFTVIPELYLSPDDQFPSVDDFDPSQPSPSRIPLDVFRNLQLLRIQGFDPRIVSRFTSLRGLWIHDAPRSEGVAAWLEEQAEAVADLRALSIVACDFTPQDTDALKWERWDRLARLDLGGNLIGFVPSGTVCFPSCLWHEALANSARLLAALSALPRLESVALSNNMISSISLVYTTLGAVTHLDLSSNRLTLLAGLERLHALEVIDLRHNRLRDLAEIGRLATLPHIRSVGVGGNPCTNTNDNWRVEVFNLFAREGKEVQLDGSGPSFTERLRIVSPSSRATAKAKEYEEAIVSQPGSSSESPQAAVDRQASKSSDVLSTKPPQHRRRKPKRIVELDGITPVSRPQRTTSPETGGLASDPGVDDGGSSPRSRTSSGHARAHTDVDNAEEESTEGARVLRSRIEALRNEAGANWLRVLGETSSGLGESGSGVKTTPQAGLSVGDASVHGGNGQVERRPKATKVKKKDRNRSKSEGG
jgi:Leucine-rich repeat (LRR) protein